MILRPRGALATRIANVMSLHLINHPDTQAIAWEMRSGYGATLAVRIFGKRTGHRGVAYVNAPGWLC